MIEDAELISLDEAEPHRTVGRVHDPLVTGLRNGPEE
jgi:hypothetical protein